MAGSGQQRVWEAGLPGLKVTLLTLQQAHSRGSSDCYWSSAAQIPPSLSGVLLCLAACDTWAFFRKASGETAVIPETGEVGCQLAHLPHCWISLRFCLIILI